MSLVDVVRRAAGQSARSAQSARCKADVINGRQRFEPTANSDITIITAGFPRKPDEPRRLAGCQLRGCPHGYRTGGCKYSQLYSDRGDEPLDAMAQAAIGCRSSAISGWDGGCFDSARFRTFIAQN